MQEEWYDELLLSEAAWLGCICAVSRRFSGFTLGDALRLYDLAMFY